MPKLMTPAAGMAPALPALLAAAPAPSVPPQAPGTAPPRTVGLAKFAAGPFDPTKDPSLFRARLQRVFTSGDDVSCSAVGKVETLLELAREADKPKQRESIALVVHETLLKEHTEVLLDSSSDCWVCWMGTMCSSNNKPCMDCTLQFPTLSGECSSLLSPAPRCAGGSVLACGGRPWMRTFVAHCILRAGR